MKQKTYFRMDATRVRLLAMNKGLSEGELLRQAGCSKDLITKARKPEHTTTARTLKKIASVLGCEPKDLIEG